MPIVKDIIIPIDTRETGPRGDHSTDISTVSFILPTKKKNIWSIINLTMHDRQLFENV